MNNGMKAIADKAVIQVGNTSLTVKEARYCYILI